VEGFLVSVTLSDDEVQSMEHAARRFCGAFTGTSGTLAGMVLRCLAERKRLLAEVNHLTVELARRDEIRRPLPALASVPD
jgi:hypothetical protein